MPARSTRGSRFSSFAGAPFAGVPGALGAAAAAEAESELKTILPESGVPRADMLELLRGPPDVLLAVWTYWKTKRENDKEGLPILSRLRQEAIQMAARKARWWSTVTDMQRLHSHLKQARARRCVTPLLPVLGDLANRPHIQLRQQGLHQRRLTHSWRTN